MPVRDKAVRHLVGQVVGLKQRAPKVTELALYHAADGLYTRTLESIDWNRVMIDASARHMSLHDGDFLTSGADDDHQAGEVCSECVYEALLANEWGGRANPDKWREHPYALKSVLGLMPVTGDQLRTVVAWLANHARRPDAAPPDMRDDDGHLQVCEEIGRHPEFRMVCHPACPHYDGWIEDLA